MAKRRKRSEFECPAPDCQGGRPGRQTQLTEGSRDRILDPDVRSEVDENFRSAYRCTYCGCVYLRLADHNKVLGTLDSGVTGKQWSSRSLVVPF